MIASSDDGLDPSNGDVGRTFTSSDLDIDTLKILSFFPTLKIELWTNLQNGIGNKQAFVFERTVNLELL